MADQPVVPTTPAPAVSATAPIVTTPGVLLSPAPAAPAAPAALAAALVSPESKTAVVTPEVAPAASGEPAVVPATGVTLLGAEPVKVDPAKPAEVKPEDKKAPDATAPVVEQKKEEGSQSEQAQLPTYEDFKLPEGFSLDKEKLGKFTNILGDIQVKTKADQKMMQEYGQQLVDMAQAEVQESVQRINDYYKEAVVKQKSDWKTDFEKDPEIGGNRMQTTLNAALNAIKEGASTSADAKVAEAQLKEVRQLMDGGIGNHKALIRTFANLHGIIKGLREKYESESGVKPLPGTKPEMKKSQVEQRYGKS